MGRHRRQTGSVTMDIGPFGITHQTVGELRAALAELPDDAPVQVRRHRHRAPSRHSVLMFRRDHARPGRVDPRRRLHRRGSRRTAVDHLATPWHWPGCLSRDGCPRCSSGCQRDLPYRVKNRTTASVSVSPRRSASSFAACHTSSGTRIDRGGVWVGFTGSPPRSGQQRRRRTWELRGCGGTSSGPTRSSPAHW